MCGSFVKKKIPQIIVNTGWISTAKEVCAPGSLGSAYVIAIQPATWQEKASNRSHAWLGHVISKLICWTPIGSNGISPRNRRPMVAPRVASSWALSGRSHLFVRIPVDN